MRDIRGELWRIKMLKTLINESDGGPATVSVGENQEIAIPRDVWLAGVNQAMADANTRLIASVNAGIAELEALVARS